MLHVSMIVLAVFGLPRVFQPDEVETQPLLVELVTVAEVTTSQAKPEPEPEPVKEVEVEKKPPPKPPEPVAASAPPPAPAPPVAKPAPPPPKPEPKPQKLAEAPKPEPKPKPEPEARPVDLSKAPKPRTRPVKPQDRFSADRIAALLDKRKQDQKRQTATVSDASAKPPKAEAKPSPRVALSSDQPLTMSEIDAIRFQIQQCWSIPAGARDAENLVVQIRIFLKPDGSLAGPPEIVDGARMNRPGQEFFRVAAESARRAVQRCSPLKNLPVAKYERWREITLTFNPKEMLQG